MMLFLCFLALSVAQQQYTSTYFSDANCMTNVSVPQVITSGDCLNDPQDPTRSARWTFETTGTFRQLGYLAALCGGTPAQNITYGNCQCIAVFAAQNNFNYYQISPTGSGSAVCGTTMAPATTVPVTNPECFHKSTIISYKGKDMSMEDLKKEKEECRIPHVVTTSGVKIEADNGKVLRLTPDHLVFTPKGDCFAIFLVCCCLGSDALDL